LGPGRKISGALVALAAATLAAGCGAREDRPDLANGKALFVGKGTCGSCHTLQRANTHGTQGPNLDQAFAEARRDGLGSTTVEGVVRRQIAHPRKGSIMPAGLVKGADARDVAAYVALVAAQLGQDTGALAQAGAPKVSNKPVVEKGGTLTIPADPSGGLAFTARLAEAKPGSVTFVMPNKAPIQHDISLKGAVSKNGPVVGQGGTSRFTASLKPGKYEFYCSVPGHEAGGMKGTLTVK
jgi:mono/diheme cytochrome c family protein